MEATQTGADTTLSRFEQLLAKEDGEGAETPPEQPLEAKQDEEAVEVEATEQPSEEGSAEKDAKSDESEQLELEKIAAALGVDVDKLDVDDDGNLYLKTKVDGVESRAKPAELLKSYQLEGHLNKKNMEVVEAQKALQTKLSEVESQSKERLEQLDNYLTMMQHQLMAEFNGVDWQQLRTSDPAEFAAKQQEFGLRQFQMQQAVDFLNGQKQKAETDKQSKQRERLKEVIPEWVSNSELWTKESNELRSYVGKIGYDASILNSAEGIALARKAMKYDALQSAKPEITKKVRIAPKLVKPGQSKTKSEQVNFDHSQLKKQVKAGSVSMADYLLKTNRV